MSWRKINKNNINNLFYSGSSTSRTIVTRARPFLLNAPIETASWSRCAAVHPLEGEIFLDGGLNPTLIAHCSRARSTPSGGLDSVVAAERVPVRVEVRDMSSRSRVISPTEGMHCGHRGHNTNDA